MNISWNPCTVSSHGFQVNVFQWVIYSQWKLAQTMWPKMHRLHRTEGLETRQDQYHANTRLCCSRAHWPLVPNFCPWATRKSYFYCTKHAGHPWFYRLRALGFLQFPLEHNLVISTNKFSILIPIHFLKEIVGRIWSKIKAFSLGDHFLDSLNLFSEFCSDNVVR